MEELGGKWRWKFAWWGLVVAVMLLAGCSFMMYGHHLEKGTAELKKGDYQMAVSSFEKAQEAKETKEAADLILGTRAAIMALDHLGEGKFEEAQAFAEEALSLSGKGEAHDALRLFAEETRKQAAEEKNRMRLIQELEKAKGEMVKGMLDEAFERASNVANDPGSIQYDTAYVAYELMNEILDKKKKKLLPDEEKQRKEGEARFLEEERMKEEARRLEQQKLEEEKRRSEEERKKKEKSSLTKEEAVQLVIEMTVMTPAESFFVEYDHHTPEGHYVIHLYEVVIDDPETREGHTATYGWYGVVPDTGEVYDYMER